MSGEGREKCESCIFRLRSHGGEVGRRMTELVFDGGTAMCGGGVVVVVRKRGWEDGERE